MRSTSAPANSSRRQLPALVGLALAALLMLVIPSAAQAAPTMSPALSSGAVVTETEPSEDLPFSFSVRVRDGGEPVSGARILVEGDGFETEGETDDKGLARSGSRAGRVHDHPR